MSYSHYFTVNFVVRDSYFPEAEDCLLKEDGQVLHALSERIQDIIITEDLLGNIECYGSDENVFPTADHIGTPGSDA
jgi:hypothetical protein